MKRYCSLLVILIAFILHSKLYGIDNDVFIGKFSTASKQDTSIENQVLYNGRIWVNLYSKVLQDQFFFSNEFLPGSVSISGRTFKNLKIRYDIFNDEIIIPTNHGSYLQLNKEMVDSFTIVWKSKSYNFRNFRDDEGASFKGYLNVLYEGTTRLFVKYQKKIQLLAVEGKYDEFYQIHRIYIVNDSLTQLIRSKRELLNTFNIYKSQVRNYIKKNSLVVSARFPESLVQVIEYYDNLNR